MMSSWLRMDYMRICIIRSGVRRDIFRCFLINSVSNIKTAVSRKLSVICTLFTGQPVRRVFLCVIVMSLK